MNPYFGKYRGKVVDNKDPSKLGRVQVQVPSVYGEKHKASWALPCVPYAGKKVGYFALPPVGANIWVEFEGGDPEYPIWSGCYWGPNELPAKAKDEKTKVFKTDAITMILDDSKGFTLEVGPPAVSQPITFICNSSGVEIKSGNAVTIKSGNAVIKMDMVKVNVNNGALEVM